MNQFGRYAGPYRKSSANSCSTVGIPSPGSQILEDENLQKPIMDYLSGFDGDDQPLQESHLLKWIEKRGPMPPPDHAHGYPQDVADLWRMQQSLDVAKTELHKLQRTYDTQSVQIDKVKAAQMNKLSPGATFGADELENGRWTSWTLSWQKSDFKKIQSVNSTPSLLMPTGISWRSCLWVPRMIGTRNVMN